MTLFADSGNETSSAIVRLDDEAAMRILAAVAGPAMRVESTPVSLTPELAGALKAEFGAAEPESSPAEGEIARQALLVLAQDPEKAGVIAMMMRNPPARRFGLDPVTGTALITLALVALQSHVEFSRDKAGKWEFKFKKKPIDTSTIKPLIQKLVALITGGPK